MWPSTRQNEGVAGMMRLAGVAPRSATASAAGSTSAAVSILVASAPAPERAAHLAAGSAPRLLPGSAALAGNEDAAANQTIAMTPTAQRRVFARLVMTLLRSLVFSCQSDFIM